LLLKSLLFIDEHISSLNHKCTGDIFDVCDTSEIANLETTTSGENWKLKHGSFLFSWFLEICFLHPKAIKHLEAV
jgi:hypothetical protein